jgi:N utilization substance protein B
VEAKRTAARELALITFSQLSKNIEKWEKSDISEIILKSIETLSKEAEDNLHASVRELSKIKEFIQNYEIDHDNNTSRPVEAHIIPVPIPMTSDMTGRIESMLLAAERMYAALDIIAISAMSDAESVKSYTLSLVKTFLENKTTVDEKINEYARGWDIDRLLKIDRDILRIAITEILYFDSKDVPAPVAIDEAVELAKKYGAEESSSFINGILRQVYESTKIKF